MLLPLPLHSRVSATTQELADSSGTHRRLLGRRRVHRDCDDRAGDDWTSPCVGGGFWLWIRTGISTSVAADQHRDRDRSRGTPSSGVPGPTGVSGSTATRHENSASPLFCCRIVFFTVRFARDAPAASAHTCGVRNVSNRTRKRLHMPFDYTIERGHGLVEKACRY